MDFVNLFLQEPINMGNICKKTGVPTAFSRAGAGWGRDLEPGKNGRK
jgi:hypothetical protein